MKRYICKKNKNRDCYKEAVTEILERMKDLENDSLMEDLNDDDTIESLLDGVNDNPIKIDHVEDTSLFEEIQNEIKKLLISGKCKYNIIQGWQFLTLYDDLENNISIFLCIYDDELGLALNME